MSSIPIETLVQDLRYGLRMLRRSPGFTLTVVITLALGIGINAAIFSLVDSVLLRPLPFKNAGRIVDTTEYSPGKVDSAGVPYPDYVSWKQANTVFEETAAYSLISASNDIVLGGPFSAERVRYSTVNNSFFTLLGIQPALGHGFSSSDETPGGAKVFLLSDAVWRGVFGGDARAIGKTYLVDGENYTLAGVMPPQMDFPKSCGIWLPISTLGESGLHDRISHPFHVLGRLRNGVNSKQAEAQIETLQRRLGELYPATDADWHVRTQPLLDEAIGNVRASLLVLLGAAGFILLIACANVANLTLARVFARDQEFAIRAALGAGRKRLLRQNLTEALLVVAISLVLSLAVAEWGLASMVSLTSIHLPRMQSFQLSMPVLLFAAAVAGIATILVGSAPSFQGAHASLESKLRGGQRSAGTDLRSRRIRSGLIVSEVALALVLLCGAGLMLKSFMELRRVDAGFETQHLMTMKVALPSASYPKAARTAVFLNQLLDRLERLPGIRSAALTTAVPLSGEWDWDSFQIVGQASSDWRQAPKAVERQISASYFRTLGLRLLRGREFMAQDARANNTIVINQAMSKTFWPGRDPIGQQIVSVDEPSNPREVIGMVSDVKSFGLGAESKPEMYTLYRGAWYMNLVLRTAQRPDTIVRAVRQQVANLDKGVPVYQVATMDQLLTNSVAPQRFDLFVLALFAALALTLAAVGLYGVLSFAVSRRVQEIGIRMSLGAQPRQILRLIIWNGMSLVVAGLAVGLFASFLLTRLMANLLFGVSATDPMTFSAVGALLTLVGLAACYIPARRAMRIDPIVSLRYQ